MIDLLGYISSVENLLWGYLAFPALIGLGVFLSFQSKFIQIRRLGAIFKLFFSLFKKGVSDEEGVHPIKAFFACVGGAIGVGNIVGVCTAIQIGGPGALFWIWVTAILGMVVKYGEVYLGILHRVKNRSLGYSGGPMYFVQQVYKASWLPKVICLFLCIYGVEVYQFNVIVSSVTQNLGLNFYFVVALLLFLVFFAGMGGVARVGNISSAVIPLFVLLYVGMSLWVLAHHVEEIPHLIATVISSAFTGHAAMGGFVGSSFHMAISQGVSRGCYTSDLGIGYASVIHSETSSEYPERQAALVVVDIFLDTFVVCSSSILLILLTNTWHQPLEASLLVQNALGLYFSHMDWFMPCFLFLLGYSTINAYFCVGLKSAEYISPRFGKKCYYVYTFCTLLLFSFVDTALAQSVMMIAAGFLLLINCYSIFMLRDQIAFDFSHEEVPHKEGVAIPLLE